MHSANVFERVMHPYNMCTVICYPDFSNLVLVKESKDKHSNKNGKNQNGQNANV